MHLNSTSVISFFLSDLHLNSIAASLPNLRVLNLDTPADFTAACVEHVASTLPHLTALSLWSDAITWETVSLLLALLPSLQRLSLISRALGPRAVPQPGNQEHDIHVRALHIRDISADSSAGPEAAGLDAASLFSSLSIAKPRHGDLFWYPSGSTLAPCLSSIRLFNFPHRSAVSHLFRHLTTLDISRNELSPCRLSSYDGLAEWKRSEEVLCQAIRGLPLLERLALPLVSDAVLLEISQSCPKLTALHAQPLARSVAVDSAVDCGLGNFYLCNSSSHTRTWLRVALPPVQPHDTDAGVLAIANGCTRLVQLSLGGCVNVGRVGLRQLASVTSTLLLALLDAARELAGKSERRRDDGAAAMVEVDGECEEEKPSADEHVGHEKKGKKEKGFYGLQDFRLRRLLVSPKVIAGDQWKGGKEGGREGMVGGGGDSGGMGSDVDLRLAAREVHLIQLFLSFFLGALSNMATPDMTLATAAGDDLRPPTSDSVCVRLRPSPFVLEDAANDPTNDLTSIASSDSKSRMLELATRFAATLRALEIRPGAGGNATRPDDDKLSAYSIVQILQRASGIESLSLVSCVEAVPDRCTAPPGFLPMTKVELATVVLPALPRQLKSLNLSSDHFLTPSACVTWAEGGEAAAGGAGRVWAKDDGLQVAGSTNVPIPPSQAPAPRVLSATPAPASAAAAASPDAAASAAAAEAPAAPSPPPSDPSPPSPTSSPPAPPPLPPAPSREPISIHPPRVCLTDVHLHTIAASLPHLTSLNLDTRATASAETICHLATSLPHLKALSLSSDAVTWEVGSLLLALLPSLQHLSLVSHALDQPRNHPAKHAAAAPLTEAPALAAAAADPVLTESGVAGDPSASSDTLDSETAALLSTLSIAAPKSGDLFYCPPDSSLAPCLSSIRLYVSPHRSVAWGSPPASSLLLALAARSSSTPLRAFHAQNSPSSTWQLVGHLFRQLTTLDLSQTEPHRPSSHLNSGSPEWKRSEEVLCQAIRDLPLLERLALPLASDAVLTAVSESCPNLTALHAQPLARFIAVASAAASAANDFLLTTSSSYSRTCLRVAPPPVQSHVTDAGVVAIANGCTRLVQLSLGGCVNVGPVGLRQLARRCGRLEVLRLARTAVDDAAVVVALFGDTWHADATAGAASTASLQLQLPQLVLLDLFDCPGVSSGLLLSLLAAARELAGNGGDGEEVRAGREGSRPGLQDFKLQRLLVSHGVIAGKEGGKEGEGSGSGVAGVDLRVAAREVGMLLPGLVVTCRRMAEHVLPWDGFFGERKLALCNTDDGDV
ncbi:unnamed protein product [Closterium sp. Naga37s-1]|nr:unnamed protein product [Closterium sp. Naga37s-1]